jgi:hypothetical protein
VTNPAKSGGVTLKSVHVTGTEPAAMMVSPARCTSTFAATSRVTPLIVKLAGTSSVIAAPVSGTAATSTGSVTRNSAVGNCAVSRMSALRNWLSRLLSGEVIDATSTVNVADSSFDAATTASPVT